MQNLGLLLGIIKFLLLITMDVTVLTKLTFEILLLGTKFVVVLAALENGVVASRCVVPKPVVNVVVDSC